MRKARIGLCVASVAMAICLAVGLTACTVTITHEHNYIETSSTATCTEDGITTYTCSECGDVITVQASALGHDYEITSETATCTSAGSVTYACSRCGDGDTINVEALGHSWDEGEVSTEATCTTSGVMKYSCTREGCDETKEVTIPATGHSYEITSSEATCETPGLVTYTCSVCESSTTVYESEPLGHSWDEGEITTEPTCTEDGEKTYTCERCNETKTEVISATGHSYELTYTSATCTESGTVSCKCSVCGASLDDVTVEALGHSWDEGEITTEATCTTAGVITYTCTREGCNETKTDTIAAKGHSYAETSRVADCTGVTVTYTCSACGDVKEETYESKGTHKWDSGVPSIVVDENGENVEIVTYTCEICGAVMTETPEEITPDDSWENSKQSETDEDGKTIEVYEVSSAEQLASLAEKVNDENEMDSSVIELANDINLGWAEWTPIGSRSDECAFSGTFDGNGYTISNLEMQEKNSDHTGVGDGLFGDIENAVITNLTIENVAIDCVDMSGAIAGFCDNPDGSTSSLISYCTVKGVVQITGYEGIGGIIGCGYQTSITNCSVEAEDGSYIKGASSYSSYGSGTDVGGIAGYISTHVSAGPSGQTDLKPYIHNVSVSGLEISGTASVGGILGAASLVSTYTALDISKGDEGSGNSVTNCTISITSYEKNGENKYDSTPYAGAVLGYASCDVNINDCTVSNVTINYYNASYVYGLSVDENGEVTAALNAGIYGKADGTITIGKNCSVDLETVKFVQITIE